MASTSNQTDSSTPHCDHDVFLSFRGPDTRNSFTSHLYDALARSGIRTFIDDEELRRGKEIKPELRKAIQGSRMSIIVFSEHYASSRWCLDELVEILECKRTNGQIVLPIFYDVEPSIVRHQGGSYAKAFEHFMEDWGPNWKKLFISCLPSRIIRGWNFAKPFENNKLAEWRAALTEAANISGYDLKNEENGNEARVITKIVRNVRPEVNLRFLNVPESLISVNSNFNCINTLLSIRSDDVRTIGIYGMGGIGKTTVSKDVYNKHLNHFEGSAFVENIKDVSKLPNGLLRLQKNLLSQLQKKKIKLSNNDEGINWLKKICCSKRVLILLDDLDDFDQIKKLAGHKRWFSAGSRVIIVTRDAKLLKEAQLDHTYEMKVLNDDESLELFRWNAFGEGIPFPSEDYKSLSIDTATYCGGLPLALEVIGRHMFGLTPLSWKFALEEFRKYPEKTVQDRLKITYDALSEHGKKIFLDVACVFIGWDKDYLVKFWNGCEFSPENSIRELLNKCLLKVDEKNCLRMHDLLRDMGRAIVLEASDRSLEKHSRVWIHEEIRDLLEHPKGAEAVEGISLDLSNLQSIALETKAFEAMHQLRFLLINKVDVTGSFQHLFGKLRWLSWQYCSLKSLPTNFHPRKLVGLDLKYSKIKKLWEGVKHLNNLKILDLSYCKSLVETPNFLGVRSLERLMLRDCNRLSTIDPSICELRSLEELHLEGCTCLDQLPEQLGNMKSLKTLNVSHTLLEGLPDSIGQLSRLVHLHLELCKELKTLPTTICNLISLEELDVSGCSILRRFPEQLGDLKCLLSLDLRFCRITNLPISMSNLRSLKKLYIGGCSNMRRLPEQLGEMKCLLDLEIRDQDNLTNLPASICDLRALKKLNFEGCSKLERLPEELGNLECLLYLDLSWCKNLINLPASTCNMTSLEKLNVGSCLNLKRLPEGMGNLKRLRSLNASNTWLEELPDSIGDLSSLVHLHLSKCRNLETLPDRICDLSSLEVLNITYCHLLQQLPDRLGNMVRLRNLDASFIGCQELPDSIKNLNKLERLSLSFLHRGPQLSAFERFVLPFKSSLKRLELPHSGLHDEDIPDDIGICLLSLQFLNLNGNDFCNLPSTLCQISNLTKLFLSNCKSLVSLPELPPNLEMLHASGCTAMEKVPNLSNLKCLRGLDFSNSNRLVLVQGLENLKLRFLDMAGCNNLSMNATFNESFFQRYFERADDDESSILLPKWNFQNWIIYQSMESTISFELPRSLPDNFQGIIFWVVYAHHSSIAYRANITNNTSGKEWYQYRHLSSSLVGHSWVSCIKKNFRSGDSIQISITEDENVKVEKCGVHWFIRSEGDEDENVHYCNTTYNSHRDDFYPVESENDDDEYDYYDDYNYDDDDDDDDDDEETERVYDDHNPTETERVYDDVNLNRGHDFDLNTEPNEESSIGLTS